MNQGNYQSIEQMVKKELRNRWYWKLKKDTLPDGDYDVREYFLNLYDQILIEMPDYLLLKDMAVENKKL